MISALFLLIPPKVNSCPIPVFRYALEYWDTDPYELEIIYENVLSLQQEEVVNYLLSTAAGDKGRANLSIRKTDAKGSFDQITQSVMPGFTGSDPIMVLRYPVISDNKEVVWSGSLSRANVDLLIDSPLRKAIGEKLTGDATGVWIFLESGDRRKDREALGVLDQELRRLEKTLVLPDRQLWLGANEELPVIKFDIVTLSRNDLQEKILLEMLLKSEEDLLDFDGEPIVFPLFGRGIILYGIVGKGINEWNIREAAEFLTGPCSCQAKVLNPGTDMLLRVDWKGLIRQVSDISIANPVSGMGDFSNREEEAKRQLESAMTRRLGAAGNNPEMEAIGAEKVVYLDIFGNSREELLEKKRGSAVDVEENQGPEVNNEPDPEPIKEDQTAEEADEEELMPEEEKRIYQQNDKIHESGEMEESGRTTVASKERDRFAILALLFGGVVFLIVLAGVIMYINTSKR